MLETVGFGGVHLGGAAGPVLILQALLKAVVGLVWPGG